MVDWSDTTESSIDRKKERMLVWIDICLDNGELFMDGNYRTGFYPILRSHLEIDFGVHFRVRFFTEIFMNFTEIITRNRSTLTQCGRFITFQPLS